MILVAPRAAKKKKKKKRTTNVIDNLECGNGNSKIGVCWMKGFHKLCRHGWNVKL